MKTEHRKTCQRMSCVFCRRSSSTAPRVSGPAVTCERVSRLLITLCFGHELSTHCNPDPEFVCFSLESKTNSLKCCDGAVRRRLTLVGSSLLLFATAWRQTRRPMGRAGSHLYYHPLKPRGHRPPEADASRTRWRRSQAAEPAYLRRTEYG